MFISNATQPKSQFFIHPFAANDFHGSFFMLNCAFEMWYVVGCTLNPNLELVSQQWLLLSLVSLVIVKETNIKQCTQKVFLIVIPSLLTGEYFQISGFVAVHKRILELATFDPYQIC